MAPGPGFSYLIKGLIDCLTEFLQPLVDGILQASPVRRLGRLDGAYPLPYHFRLRPKIQ